MASTACKQPQAATLHVGDRGDSPADGMRRGAAPRAWQPAARRLEALEPGTVGAHGARAREPARAQQRRGAQAERVVRRVGRPVHLVVRAPARGSGCVSSAPLVGNSIFGFTYSGPARRSGMAQSRCLRGFSTAMCVSRRCAVHDHSCSRTCARGCCDTAQRAAAPLPRQREAADLVVLVARAAQHRGGPAQLVCRRALARQRSRARPEPARKRPPLLHLPNMRAGQV